MLDNIYRVPFIGYRQVEYFREVEKQLVNRRVYQIFPKYKIYSSIFGNPKACFLLFRIT